MQRIKRLGAGLGAIVALLALVIGLPLVLWAVSGNPLPTALSIDASIDALTSPDKVTVVLTVLRTVAWVAWAVFAISTCIELVAAISGRAARRLPGFGWSQRSAAGLISAAALAVVALTGTAPAMAADAGVASQTSVGTTVSQTVQTKQQPSDVSLTKVREGDTLWGIAERKLGDGDKWPRIARATKPITQPDGQRLTDPDVIVPGWKVAVPQSHAATKDQTKPDKRASTPLQEQAAAASVVQPEVQAATEPAPVQEAQIAPQDVAVVPPTQIPTPAGAPQQSTAETTTDPVSVSEGEQESAGNHIGMLLGVGSVFATGFLGLVALKRRRQRSKLTPGQRIPLPTDDSAQVEQQLRSLTDMPALDAADRALRAFCAHVGETNQPVPTLRAARMTSAALELYFDNTNAVPQLPRPWRKAAGEDVVFTFALADIDELGDVPDATPAPYPALVVIGVDDDGGQVMVDLETAGRFRVVGTPEQTKAVVLSMAIELGTSTFADSLRVFVDQSLAELAPAIGNGAVIYRPTFDSVLTDIERTVKSDRSIFFQDGVQDLAHARSALLAEDTWPPSIALVHEDLSDATEVRVDALFCELPRTAASVVTQHRTLDAGQDDADVWALRFTSDTEATLEPFNLPLTPQMVADDVYASMLTTLNMTEYPPLGAPDPRATIEPTVDELPPPAPEPAAPEAPVVAPKVETAVAVDVHEHGTDADPTETDPGDLGQDGDDTETVIDLVTEHSHRPRVLLLGSIGLENTAGLTDRPGSIELAAHILLRPNAVNAEINEALWPGKAGGNAQRRKAATTLRTWLGATDDGSDHFPAVAKGKAPYLVDVDCDWHDLLAHIPDGPASATTDGLGAALELVRGKPFADARLGKYAWAEYERIEMCATIVEIAAELANRQLRDGTYEAATRTATRGLAVAEENETLWRLKIKALTRYDGGQARSAAKALMRIADAHECGLDEETETLIRDVLAKAGAR